MLIKQILVGDCWWAPKLISINSWHSHITKVFSATMHWSVLNGVNDFWFKKLNAGFWGMNIFNYSGILFLYIYAVCPYFISYIDTFLYYTAIFLLHFLCILGAIWYFFKCIFVIINCFWGFFLVVGYVIYSTASTFCDIVDSKYCSYRLCWSLRWTNTFLLAHVNWRILGPGLSNHWLHYFATLT